MQRKIARFYQDEEMHWVAEMECGHTQHMRHNPPWQTRPWVITAQGRQAMLGTVLLCKECQQPSDAGNQTG